MQRRRFQALGLALAYAALAALSRPWHRTWGATATEASAPLAGDGLVHEAGHQTTRAIDIRAPVSQVWPWLIQMGQGRGGLYTYEWIENALGAQIHNLDRIDPELQRLQVGDRIRLTPERYLGRIPGQFYRVEGIRLERDLTMLQQLPGGGESSWSFTVRSPSEDATRLIVRGRTSRPGGLAERIARQLELLLLEPGYFVMERGMLRGIRARAEGGRPRRAKRRDPHVAPRPA